MGMRLSEKYGSRLPLFHVIPKAGEVVYYPLGQRQRYGNIVLLCGTRAPQGLPYRRELESTCGTLPDWFRKRQPSKARVG